MKVPNLEQAMEFIKFAEEKNPGEWIAHSYNVAKAAKSIASQCDNLDGDTAYILGLLHDVRYGISDFTLPKWKAYLGLRDYFSEKIGNSIYEVLDGVVETTFGL